MTFLLADLVVDMVIKLMLLYQIYNAEGHRRDAVDKRIARMRRVASKA